jgi:RNA ligase (TIGR02306 family)
MALASIEVVTDVQPIEGADKIEAASVLGYKTVIKKGELKTGDWCVFHNPDTIIDVNNPAYAFLNGDARLRVRKFKKQVSQGLALPLTVLFKDVQGTLGGAGWTYNTGDPANPGYLSKGQDVTDLIKAIKYEKTLPVSMLGVAKGNFPAFLVKTDENNLRSNPKVLKELTEQFCYITQKIDGCSATFYYNDGQFGACSRNMDLKDTETSIYWKIARQYNLDSILSKTGKNLAIQGEIYGEGIQGNKLKVTGNKLALFNLFDIDQHKYADYDELTEFCKKTGLPIVETIWAGAFRFSLAELIEMANKQEYMAGVPAEGIVIRPCLETESEALGHRLSVKVISETFALKHGE